MLDTTMRPSTRMTAIVGGLCLTTLLTVVMAGAQKSAAKKDPSPACTITPLQAIKIATDKVSGRVLNANFELDEGKWVYGVMIVSGKKIQEVEIDPMTGTVGGVEEVTPEGEAAEVKAQLTKALGEKAKAKTRQQKEIED